MVPGTQPGAGQRQKSNNKGFIINYQINASKEFHVTGTLRERSGKINKFCG
jgi:hypothetical protein